MRHKYNEKVLSVHISSIHPSILHGVLVGASGGYHVVGTPGVEACHVPGAKPTNHVESFYG
jgi:hypothetical protein